MHKYIFWDRNNRSITTMGYDFGREVHLQLVIYLGKFSNFPIVKMQKNDHIRKKQ